MIKKVQKIKLLNKRVVFKYCQLELKTEIVLWRVTI